MEKVITISGNENEKSKCRLIEKEYYLIGDNNIEDSGDVYLINNRYIRFNTERLVFNHSVKEYQLKNDGLEYGIIDMNKSSDFIFGWFSKNFENQHLINKDKKTYLCINENIINKSFREEIYSGIFYHISLKKASQFNLIKPVKKEYKESFPYDSNGIMGDYINAYENEYDPIINSTIERYGSAIGNLTFGFEFETTKGTIPINRLNKLPLIPLRDGSIAGLEYVTIPLSGKKGIKAVIDCVGELQKRTEYDNDCSLHLHIGNIPRTPEFILSFYKLISYYQNEIFSLFPLYKKYNFGVKRKNYSEPFPFNEINSKLDPSINIENKDQVNKNFDVLFSHLTSENSSFYDYKCDLKNVYSHPSDPNGNQKWNIKKRYYAHNLIPLIFGNKQTIEFRIHTPTYDVDKILNFLFINSYLINYAINNQNTLLSDPYFLERNIGKKLDKIICSYLTTVKTLSSNEKQDLMSYHLNYVNERKTNVYQCNCNGDIIGKEDNIHCYQSIDWKESGVLNNSYNMKKSLYNTKINTFNDFMSEGSVSYVDENGVKVNGINFGSIRRDEKSTIKSSSKISSPHLNSYPSRDFGESHEHYKRRVFLYEQGKTSSKGVPVKSDGLNKDHYDMMMDKLKESLANGSFNSLSGDRYYSDSPITEDKSLFVKDYINIAEDDLFDFSEDEEQIPIPEKVEENVNEKKFVFSKPKSKFW